MRKVRLFHYFTILIMQLNVLKGVHTYSQSSKTRYLPLIGKDNYFSRKGQDIFSVSKSRNLESKGMNGRKSSIAIGRRQLEELPYYLPQKNKGRNNRVEPSCSELRFMWRQMKRLTRQSELTNEIPQVFPDSKPQSKVSRMNSWMTPINYPTNPRKSSRQGNRGNPIMNKNRYFEGRWKQKYAKQQKPKMLGFGKFFDNKSSSNKDKVQNKWNSARHTTNNPNPIGSKWSNRQHVDIERQPQYYGTFVDVPMPVETLGAYGTMVYSPFDMIRNQYKNRRLGKQRGYVDMYKLSDLYNRRRIFPSRSGLRNRYRNRAVSNQQYIRRPRPRFKNNEDDAMGFRSFADNDQQNCGNGKCREIYKDENGRVVDDFGIWHNNPLDLSEMGLLSKSKRMLLDLIDKEDELSPETQ